MTSDNRVARWLLRALNVISAFIEIVFTRTRVTGLENVPHEGGPFIFAPNHASTYDVVVLMRHMPLPVRPVGPGDFPLLFPANLLVEKMGIIRIMRGSADRESLKKMSAVLKNGENLSLFPEGGTWEKRLDDVKPGVAYLSYTTGAQIIPVSIGGTYDVWRHILRLERPQIILHFAPPMPPVEVPDRKRRAEDLRAASLSLMQTIYDHLPPDEQSRYDLHARQRFSATLESVPVGVWHAPTDTDFGVLAELVSKPNLVGPLADNLRLPLQPLLDADNFYPAAAVLNAVAALQVALTETLPEFLNYRLGDVKAARGLEELTALYHAASEALAQEVWLRFAPAVHVEDEPLPPNA